MRSARDFIKPSSGWGSEGTRRKICASLPPEVMEQLSLHAEREGKSISSTIADLVKAGLDQKAPPMSENVKQWPDNIVSGDIRYGNASNYDGFYLADVEHGIPTFGSVTETASPTIRGQHVSVFNYPGQTEAIASELVRRWNSHNDLLRALKALAELNDNHGPFGGELYQDRVERAWDNARAAIAKAETRP